MKLTVAKRSIVIAGHKTSVSLEDAFWKGVKEIARGRNVPLAELITVIDSERKHGNLSSAIRLFVLDHYRRMIDLAAAERTPPQQAMAHEPAPLRSIAAEPGRP